jgi:ketosteroid isomerase-like protein
MVDTGTELQDKEASGISETVEMRVETRDKETSGISGTVEMRAVEQGKEIGDSLVTERPDETEELLAKGRSEVTGIAIAGQIRESEVESQKVEPDPFHAEKDQIASQVESWRQAWEEKRLDDYIAHYHPDFVGSGKDIVAWERHKEKLSTLYQHISVQVSDLTLKVDGDQALVYFNQKYRSDSYTADGYKLLELKKKDGSWLIYREHWFSEKPVNWPT